MDADASSDANRAGDAAPVTEVANDAASSGDASTPAAPPDAGVDVAPQVPLRKDLSLLLHLDESRWSGAIGEVRDESGLANNGSIVGNAQTTSDGRFGGAAQLDATGWVTVPDDPTLRPAGALTVSVWFYLAMPPQNWPGLVAKRVGFGTDVTFALMISPEALIYVDVAGEESRFNSSSFVTAERWHHVAFTFDGSAPSTERVRLYLDGVLDRVAPEASDSIPAYTADLQIGNLPNGGDAFIGRIDDVALWTRALSAQEIASLANATSSF